MSQLADIGVLGLAVMGANLARNAARNGFGVALYNRHADRTEALVREHGHEGRFLPATAEPILIVLVEDDDGHAQSGGAKPQKGRSGQRDSTTQGWPGGHDFVQGKGAYGGRTTTQPMLFLLDIQDAPRGRCRSAAQLQYPTRRPALVPVIMLTTTDDPREIDRCYEFGCSVYITKPVDYQPFVEAINRLGLFLQVVRIPDTKHVNP